MKYCSRCLMPDTKPYLTFDKGGVCTACANHDRKKAAQGIDWQHRAREFADLVRWARDEKAPVFDAAVPVSGGKDSISQVHRLLSQGLRILAINIDYGLKTEIGKANLELIPRMGAHVMTVRPEQELHTRLIRIGLEDYGDPDLLSHGMLHGLPLRIAAGLKVPLFLHGENSAFEYGGDRAISENFYFTRQWFDKYALNHGVGPREVAAKYGIPVEQLKAYDYPDDIDLARTKPVFCSYYFCWDSEVNLEIARGHGFRSLSEPREGTYRTYVGIDEKINRLHQYLKVLKFGYGRATDHACEDIRNGRLSREEAKARVKQYDLQPLGEDYVTDICAYLGYSRQRFDEVLEGYRNKSIWSYDKSRGWHIPGHLEG